MRVCQLGACANEMHPKTYLPDFITDLFVNRKGALIAKIFSKVTTLIIVCGIINSRSIIQVVKVRRVFSLRCLRFHFHHTILERAAVL